VTKAYVCKVWRNVLVNKCQVEEPHTCSDTEYLIWFLDDQGLKKVKIVCEMFLEPTINEGEK